MFKVGDIIKVFLYAQYHDNITGRYFHDQSSFHFPNNGDLYDRYGRLVFQKVSE